MLVFLLIQIVFLFIFYRLVLRPLSRQINVPLLERHLENELTKAAEDTANLVRTKLLELEGEGLEAVVKYEGLKGVRLNTTEKGEREALKKTIKRLSSTIEATQKRLGELYKPSVLEHIRKIEEARFVAAPNRYLDQLEQPRRKER